jgi:hypothetical protein
MAYECHRYGFVAGAAFVAWLSETVEATVDDSVRQRRAATMLVSGRTVFGYAAEVMARALECLNGATVEEGQEEATNALYQTKKPGGGRLLRGRQQRCKAS